MIFKDMIKDPTVDLVIDIQRKDRSKVHRNIAELFVVEEGFVFADVFWSSDNAQHPFHRVPCLFYSIAKGPVFAFDGLYDLEGAKITIGELEDGDSLAASANDWSEWRQTNEGKEDTRKSCWISILLSGILDDQVAFAEEQYQLNQQVASGRPLRTVVGASLGL